MAKKNTVRQEFDDFLAGRIADINSVKWKYRLAQIVNSFCFCFVLCSSDLSAKTYFGALGLYLIGCVLYYSLGTNDGRVIVYEVLRSEDDE